MNIKKSIGANTEPWGTPWVRYWDEDSTLLMAVRCLRDVKPAAHESYLLSKKLLVPVSSADSSPCAGAFY